MNFSRPDVTSGNHSAVTGVAIHVLVVLSCVSQSENLSGRIHIFIEVHFTPSWFFHGCSYLASCIQRADSADAEESCGR